MRLTSAFEGRKKQLGMDNADTISAFTKLADVYLQLQNWPKSLALFIEEHERLKQKFASIIEDSGVSSHNPARIPPYITHKHQKVES